MSSSPYRTYLAERLQSARGLGWEMPEFPPLPKGGRGNSMAPVFRRRVEIPPNPPLEKGGVGWVAIARPLFRWLGLARG